METLEFIMFQLHNFIDKLFSINIGILGISFGTWFIGMLILNLLTDLFLGMFVPSNSDMVNNSRGWLKYRRSNHNNRISSNGSRGD